MFLYKLINYLHKPVLLVCWPDHNSCRIAPPHHPDRSSHRTADTEWLPDRACSYQGDTHCTVFGLSTLQKKKIIIITRFRFSCVILVYTLSAKIWLCQDWPVGIPGPRSLLGMDIPGTRYSEGTPLAGTPHPTERYTPWRVSWTRVMDLYHEPVDNSDQLITVPIWL